MKLNTALLKAIEANRGTLLDGKIMVLQNTKYTTHPVLVLCRRGQIVVHVIRGDAGITGLILYSDKPPSYRRVGFISHRNGEFSMADLTALWDRTVGSSDRLTDRS